MCVNIDSRSLFMIAPSWKQAEGSSRVTDKWNMVHTRDGILSVIQKEKSAGALVSGSDS